MFVLAFAFVFRNIWATVFCRHRSKAWLFFSIQRCMNNIHLCLRKDNVRECEKVGSMKALQLDSIQCNAIYCKWLQLMVKLTMKNIIIFISQDIHNTLKNSILRHSADIVYNLLDERHIFYWKFSTDSCVLHSIERLLDENSELCTKAIAFALKPCDSQII